MVTTGVPALDKGLRGGFECPSAVLLFSEVLAEKRIFAEQFVVTGVRQGETCLYVDFYRAPQFARKEFAKFGEFPQERLVFVDTTSVQTLMRSEEKYVVQDISDLDAIRDLILQAIRETKPSRIVLDSLEFLSDRFERGEVVAFLKDLIDAAKASDAVLGLLFVNWHYDAEGLREILDHSDYLLEFKSGLKGGILLNQLRVMEQGEGGRRTNWVPFDFKELMGLVIYFPRVLVTGPYHAGKSTLVRQLSQTAVSVDRMGTTVAFDYGSVEVSGAEVELLGTPGQARFEFIFRIFAREVNGLLLVVDSTRPEDFPRARRMRQLAGQELPVVVVANKRDLAEALPLEEIREGLELDDRVPVVETVATDGAGVREALERLVEMIIWGWPS